MKTIKTIALNLIFVLTLTTCKKKEEPPPPDGKITFWASQNNGCGSITVSIDGSNVGTLNNWQVVAPTTCASSNLLLVITTKQGDKSVTFKNNCKTWTVKINLNTDCYIYNIF